ncbi:MAG: AraC family ligand binding domain-containing protein [Dysosmobacter sp.]
MRQAARTARYDQALGLEVYSLRAVDRPFPSHFHDHYVIGVVERGTRTLTCGRQQQVIGPGDVLLFNPGDSHACIQADGSLDYRGLNIPRSTMLALAEEIMGSRAMPGFSVAVVRDGELAGRLRALHRAVLGEEPELRREEGAAAGLGPPAAGLRRDGGNGFCLPGGGGADLCVHPELTMPGISRWRSSAFRRD